MSLKRKLSFRTKTQLQPVPFRVKCEGACKQNEEVDVVHSSTALKTTTMLSDCDEIVSNRQTDDERVSQDVENTYVLKIFPNIDDNTDVPIASEPSNAREPLIQSERFE